VPNSHPFIVHFPIALLLVALLLEVIALLWRNPEFSRAGWWNQIAGTLGLALAVASGLLGRTTVRIAEDARELFERHEQIAFAATALFAVLLFWRIASRGQIPLRPPWLFLLCFAAGVALLLTGAFYGGEIVYRYGVGVR
jgi:uncharacterized membrane protein